jgi:hypothetical protein
MKKRWSSEGWFVSNYHSYGNITIFPYWRPPNNQTNVIFLSDKMSINSYIMRWVPPKTIGNTWVNLTLIKLFLKFLINLFHCMTIKISNYSHPCVWWWSHLMFPKKLVNFHRPQEMMWKGYCRIEFAIVLKMDLACQYEFN